MIGEPAEIARLVGDARIDARNLRCAAQSVDPRRDLIGVLRHRVPFGRREDDIQLIEAAEAREKGPERLNHRTVVGEQRQNIGVEGQPPRARGGHDDGAEHDGRYDTAMAMRQADDCGDEGAHEMWIVCYIPATYG